MESKNLERKLQDWARNLNFKLPDGSAPPANYFNLLTATPHRRQLWEVLIESVQPRKKIVHKRKQIFIATLKDRKAERQKISKKVDLGILTDRAYLCLKQNELENKMKGKKDEAIKLERSIIIKASDMLFDICKLSELERIYEEYSERELILRLLTKREKNIINNFDKVLMKIMKNDSHANCFGASVMEKNLDSLKNEFFNVEKCNNPFDAGHHCELVQKLKKFYELGMEEKNFWEEVIECKKSLLEKFSMFLSEINSKEKTLLCKNELEMEKKLSASIIELKQKVTEWSLQVILNSTEGFSLDYELERMTETLLDCTERTKKKRISLSGIFNEPISPIQYSGCLAEMERATVPKLIGIMEVLGLQHYESFLKEEKKKLGEEVSKIEIEKKKDETKSEEKEKKLHTSEERFQSFKCLVKEISLMECEGKMLLGEIVHHYDKLKKMLQPLLEDAEQKKKKEAMDSSGSLKSYSRRLVEAFVETPFDAFRTIESSEGHLLFECASLPHCFSSYGGELKPFLSSMLIPPEENSREILSEVERRQKILAEIRNVIRRREDLTRQQKTIQQRMTSIKWDTRLCERNFSESDAVLWNVLARAEELPRRIDFIERILKNWVEQPYRLMIGKN